MAIKYSSEERNDSNSQVLLRYKKRGDKQMGMTLVELQNVLGDRINVTLSEMKPEQRQTENEQSYLVMNLAKQMINNGDLILRTEKLMAQAKCLKDSIAYRLING